jgi:hypothetical protein
MSRAKRKIGANGTVTDPAMKQKIIGDEIGSKCGLCQLDFSREGCDDGAIVKVPGALYTVPNTQIEQSTVANQQRTVRRVEILRLPYRSPSERVGHRSSSTVASRAD